MSAKIQTLESSHASAKQEVTDLKTKQAAALKDCEGINASLSQFRTKEETINAKLKELESKCLYMEAYSSMKTLNLKTLKKKRIQKTPKQSCAPFF